jgi:hypothetical protein
VNLIAKDPLQRKIEIYTWIFLAVVFIPSLIFGTFKFALGVLLGGLISIINFYWMGRSLRGAFYKTGGSVRGNVVFKYFIRLLLTAIVLYLLISKEVVNIIGLLIGLSVVVLTVVFTVIITYSKKNLIKESL